MNYRTWGYHFSRLWLIFNPCEHSNKELTVGRSQDCATFGACLCFPRASSYPPALPGSPALGADTRDIPRRPPAPWGLQDPLHPRLLPCPDMGASSSRSGFALSHDDKVDPHKNKEISSNWGSARGVTSSSSNQSSRSSICHSSRAASYSSPYTTARIPAPGPGGPAQPQLAGSCSATEEAEDTHPRPLCS